MLEKVIPKIDTKNEFFIFQDETELYYFRYDKSNNIIVILKKDTYKEFEDLKYSIARWIEFTRFGNNNYFWVHTNTNILVAHPHRKSDIGKDDTFIRDSKNTLFIQKLVKSAIKDKNGAYIEYFWPKPGEKDGSKTLVCKII